MTIEMNELGYFYVFNEWGDPIAGPYDTLEDAEERYPDAEFIYDVDGDDG